MKKRTGAQSAMAELLSKSNETQIKDRKVASDHVRRPAPAKNPEIKKENITAERAKAVHAAEKINAAAKIPATKSARPVVTEKAAALNPIQVPQRMPAPRRNTAVHLSADAMPRKKTAARRTKFRVPAKAPMYIALALSAVGICIALAAVISTVSTAAFEPDACIGNTFEVSETAPAHKVAEADAVKHDGRNYITISIFEGEDIVCSTGESTVGEVLESMNVTVEGDYVLRGEESDSITSDSVISIDKVTYGTVTEQSAVPYETKYVDVQNIAKGKTKVVKAGTNGVSTATYKVTYVNGVESERVLESEIVTTQPTNQVVNRGVGGYVTIGGKNYSYSYYIDCKTTVYTGGGTTASGLPATENVIAVDPRVIPLGTQVYVADPYCYVGIRTAADTGGSIKGNFIDIYFDEDNPSLWGYGIRSARVYILD